MMRDHKPYIEIRAIFMIYILSALLLASCTVQNSGSVSESFQPAGTIQGSGVATDGLGRKAGNSYKKIRADYLKPVDAIQNPVIVVQKEKRRLYLFDKQVLVRDYPVALGWSPVGDKERSGDGRTPEGEFFICGKADEVGAIKYVLISYPGLKHAERARFQGIMSTAGVQSIVKALEKGEQPPSDTPLGGKVGIRGGGAHGDWTDGSVALYDSDMGELHKIARLGTPVLIRP